jgi:hypothetical protein
VVTWYLRTKLVMMRTAAEHRGDPSRAAVITVRLAQFDEEVRG